METIRKDKHYTAADYASWDDNERYELIDGVPYKMMSPAPSKAHQSILLELAGQLRDFLKGKACRVFIAPFDVFLNLAGSDDIVVQPDIVVICDKSKLDDKGYKGVPDFVAEILSPSTAGYDRVIKFNTYLRAGVREYWIVDPDSRTVQVNLMEAGKYVANAYADADIAPVHVLKGCEIILSDVFAE